MNFSILYRVLFFSFLFLFIFPINAQLDDIGITVDLQPNVDFRDSLDFYIYEGDSPEFIQDAEGGALDIIGGNIESATFQVYNQNGAPKKLTGKIFVQPNLNKTVVTFLDQMKNAPSRFSFKIVSRTTIELNSIMIFPIDREMPGIARALEPVAGDVPKPTIISREEWGAEEPKSGYSYHPYFEN